MVQLSSATAGQANTWGLFALRGAAVAPAVGRWAEPDAGGAAGTATLALSFWNLLHHRPAGAGRTAVGRTAVGVVNFNGSGSGLVLTRRF